eukprot:608254-Rhodomonas_salina.3
MHLISPAGARRPRWKLSRRTSTRVSRMLCALCTSTAAYAFDLAVDPGATLIADAHVHPEIQYKKPQSQSISVHEQRNPIRASAFSVQFTAPGYQECGSLPRKITLISPLLMWSRDAVAQVKFHEPPRPPNMNNLNPSGAWAAPQAQALRSTGARRVNTSVRVRVNTSVRVRAARCLLSLSMTLSD